MLCVRGAVYHSFWFLIGYQHTHGWTRHVSRRLLWRTGLRAPLFCLHRKLVLMFCGAGVGLYAYWCGASRTVLFSQVVKEVVAAVAVLPLQGHWHDCGWAQWCSSRGGVVLKVAFWIRGVSLTGGFRFEVQIRRVHVGLELYIWRVHLQSKAQWWRLCAPNRLTRGIFIRYAHLTMAISIRGAVLPVTCAIRGTRRTSDGCMFNTRFNYDVFLFNMRHASTWGTAMTGRTPSLSWICMVTC